MNRVVNVRKDFSDIYVGRKYQFHPGSPWQNPFHIRGFGPDERLRVIREYIAYFYAPEQKWLREKAIAEIPSNAILGCWCAPSLCHAEIIAGYLEWKRIQ